MAKEKYTGPRVTDTSTFITKSRWKHGNHYDYSQSTYVDSTTKVRVVCKRHGVFEILPSNHASAGQGCPECASKRPLRKQAEYYIEKSEQKHGNKYDYSQVEYKGVKIKVEIICPTHGSFWQSFDNHANNGKGCLECGFISLAEKRRKDTKFFIEKSKEYFGDLYSYELSEYVDQSTNVDVVCEEHGVFSVPPMRHYSGQGCPDCAKKNVGLHNKVSHKDFLDRATMCHNGFYNYDKVTYETLRDMVVITCPKHGDYLQRAGDHMRGRGCRDCWLESYGYGVNGYYGTNKPSSIYVFKVNNEFIKIGLSNNVYRRMLSIAKQSGYAVEKVLQVDGIACELFYLEQHILRDSCLNQFTPQYKFNGISECLELSELPKVLQIIEDWEEDQKDA